MNRLLRARKSTGLKQYEVSKLTGINVSTLSFYEQGLREPTVKNAKILGKFYGFEWSKIFEEDEEQ